MQLTRPYRRNLCESAFTGLWYFYDSCSV